MRDGFVSAMLVAVCLPCAAGTVRLRATADVWLSDANAQERKSSAGKHGRFKIKSIQEMAAVRFDASPAKGREVKRATLFLHRAGSDQLRYVRVSTVNQDWKEGKTRQAYGAADGATYFLADHNAKRPWAWPGSCFADVIMTSGNTLATWAERKELDGGWISVELTPELVYAMAVGDSDGLALMDGGTISLHNNFVHSLESGANAPYIEAELGEELTAVPAKPRVRAVPAPERAHVSTGALKVTIQQAKNVFCWRLKLDGEPVERWRVKHPGPAGPTVFHLEDLAPSRSCDLEVVAVSPGGRRSSPAELTVRTSPVLSQRLSLGTFREPRGGADPPAARGGMKVRVFPGLVKVGPEKPEAMFKDAAGARANAVWDGRGVRLFGAKGEYVSYQLCIEKLNAAPLTGVRVRPGELKGRAGKVIGGTDIELFKNWYAKNRDGKWQPAYCIPMKHGQAFQIPDPERSLPSQNNQGIYVDVYIPKDASAGYYRGEVTVEAEGAGQVRIPVSLRVYGFGLPDKLSFWPELNAYRTPRPAHDYYRLAHQHRCVLNCWVWKPRLQGRGKDIRVVWDGYDGNVGPLLTGEAFRKNRRSGQPVECMYLPFADSWPTRLSKETYRYQGYWPGRGDDNKWITEHYLKAPYIGDALSRDYKDAFLAVQRQFIEHFEEKGYTRTEMQCFYGGKNTHRTQYGSNMWWTTDEPYHWDDWLALQFFLRLWVKGRGEAELLRWAGRADISRPQWQGRVLEGVVDTVYFGTGAFMQYRRCRTLERETGLKLMCYGSANRDNVSNTQSVVWLLNVWLNRGDGALPWQTMGGEKSLDVNDRGAGGGNALLVPGKRFGLAVVGDMRLKALREGQQICEYLAVLARRRNLQREQLKVMVHRAVHFKAGTRAGAGADNADALQFSTLKAWQISELRRALAELIARGG